MDILSESLSAMTRRDKIVTAGEAVALIRDGDTVVVEGLPDNASPRSSPLRWRRAANRLPTGSDVGFHCGTRESVGPWIGPAVLRRPFEASDRRTLGNVGRARQDGR